MMRSIIKIITAISITLINSANVFAQEGDLMNELEKSSQEPVYVSQAFKGTRLVNGHTVETIGQGNLEFIFAHRFGRMNGGLYELFGLDDAYIRIGLEYGVTKNFDIGIGRSSVDKSIDSYLKYCLLRQSKQGIPVTITAFGSVTYKTSPKKEDVPEGFQTTDRLAYTGQVLIARRINSKLSLQLMPTYVHKNWIPETEGSSDQMALGVGGRIKLSRSVSVNAEYYYRINPDKNSSYQDALGLAIDIETGGHVFQIVLTNTRGMIERTFVTETDGNFFDGDIHLGFNITRAFQLNHKK
ncbi:MAG: DUF5777 family beta-barrel protein [Chryseolinea sp.]